ncbi:DUF4296 domain-containing protein [Sphingobacterium sp. SGG-5]|uniref:DUF4296 domain-containing protein n=1 Tax=Sphingobacterium sp. SGG-5 TaxID=2710881 RepID=UPI0013E9A98B|nr:DUF4296 domain-containing protein [Sphingobacterium sp. SGG-5]NGM61826.1 DUF4296 domain-containing protein [Sphingobacterium sp. SGG-5]
MERLFIALIALFFLTASCSKPKPKGILSEEKISDLMTEVYLLDSYLNTLAIDSGRKVMPVLYANLFDKFGIDSARFADNIDYYYGNPIALEKLQTTVKEVLTQYEKDALKLDSIEHARVRDSINRVTHLEQWAAAMKDLILNVHLDTTDYTIEANNTSFFQPLASSRIYRHRFTKPTPSDPEEGNAGEDRAEIRPPFIDTVRAAHSFEEYRIDILR